MCNEAGEISKLSMVSHDLFELNKELAETREKLHDLSRRRAEAIRSTEPERLAAIDQWIDYLQEKAVRLTAELAGFEEQAKARKS